MAIKKYRVAHHLESLLLGVLICVGLVLVFASGERENMTHNKQVVHLNRIYQDKIATMDGPNLEDTVTTYFGADGQVREILTLSNELDLKIKNLLKDQRCKEKQDCKDKIERLSLLLRTTQAGV